MAIVDFHTHFFSSTYFRALAAQSPLAGSVETKLAGVAEKTGVQIPEGDTARHVERWMAELDKHGVEHIASFASVPDENATLAEALELSKGRISAFAFVNPMVEGHEEKLAWAMTRKGFKGALVFPALHHFAIDGAPARPLLQTLERHEGIVFVHCGLLVVKLRDLLGIPRTQNIAFANPLSVIAAANAFPKVKFVIPHFGAGFLRETLMCGAQCPNVYVDTSSSNNWIATTAPRMTLRDVFERTLDVFGARRVLFGTDSNTFPAGWRRERYEEQRTLLASASVNAADQELIFAGNARRLLGLA